MNHVGLWRCDQLCSAGAWLCAGALIGTIHFTWLRRNAAALITRHPVLLPLGMQFLRLVVTGVMLLCIVRIFGAMPLLVATAGALVARTALIRREMQS